MRAEEFWTAFFDKVMKTKTETRKELVDLWDNSKDFTDKMTEIISGIIKEFDKTLTVQPEYLRIDIPARKKNNGNGNEKSFCKVEPNFEKYDWNLEIAVEHENNYRLWMDEVIKLAHINCPLRVVIGYVHVEKNGNNISRDKTQKKQLEILAQVADLLENNIVAWNNINPNYPNDFLIILGDGNVRRKDDRCYYTPYMYNRNKKCFEEGRVYWSQRGN